MMNVELNLLMFRTLHNVRKPIYICLIRNSKFEIQYNYNYNNSVLIFKHFQLSIFFKIYSWKQWDPKAYINIWSKNIYIYRI